MAIDLFLYSLDFVHRGYETGDVAHMYTPLLRTNYGSWTPQRLSDKHPLRRSHDPTLGPAGKK